MILTQPPPSFLLDVTLFTVFFLELVPYPCQTPDRLNLNAVVALAPAGNQIKSECAGKLGLG